MHCNTRRVGPKILVVAVSKVEVQVLMMVQFVLVVSAWIQKSKIQIQNRKKNLGLWNFPRHAYIGRKLLARKFRIQYVSVPGRMSTCTSTFDTATTKIFWTDSTYRVFGDD